MKRFSGRGMSAVGIGMFEANDAAQGFRDLSGVADIDRCYIQRETGSRLPPAVGHAVFTHSAMPGIDKDHARSPVSARIGERLVNIAGLDAKVILCVIASRLPA